MPEKTENQEATPNTSENPKRVVRTYQSDAALLAGTPGHPGADTETGKKDATKRKKGNSQKEKIVEQQKGPAAIQESVPAPQVPKVMPQPKTEQVTLEQKEPLEAPEKKHYVEELRASESFDVDAEMLSQEDGTGVEKTIPENRTVATPPPRPLPKKELETQVSFGEASPKKRGFFGSILSFLLSTGTSEKSRKEAAPKKLAPPTIQQALRQETPKPLPKKEVSPTPTAPVPQPVSQQALEPKPEPAPAPTPPKATPPPLPPQKEIPDRNLFKAPPVVAPKQEIRSVPTPPPIPQPPKDISTADPLKTYSGDARAYRATGNASPISVLAQQQDAKKLPPKPVQKKRSMLPMFIGGGALLAGGIGIIIFTYTALLDREPIAPPTRVVTPVYTDERIRITADQIPEIVHVGDALGTLTAPGAGRLATVLFERTTSTGETSILTLSDILMASSGVPGNLARAVYPQSMLGIYGDQKEPVLVLAVSSFDRSLRSMLTWEQTITATLAPLYGAMVTQATTTPSRTNQFIDVVLETYDARILYDDVGAPHITYGFVRNNILFITQTPETFLDLARRINE